MQHSNQPHSALIPKHGGYRNLKTFQIAQLVYDLTVTFCDRHIDRRSRTHDQMVQAARSGVQNIAEGSQASATSKKFELKLTSVARASLEELRLDYQDYLRQRSLHEWPRSDTRRDDLVARRPQTIEDIVAWMAAILAAAKAHEEGAGGGQGGPSGQAGLSGQRHSALSTESNLSTSSTSTTPSTTRPDEAAANAALVLINVASTLLARQINSLALAFESQGGFTERLYNVRRGRRDG